MVGTYFDPVPLNQVRKGDVLMVGTSPGFKIVEVVDVRMGRNHPLINVATNAYTDDEARTNGAWVEFGKTGNALVRRPAGQRDRIRR